MFDEEEEGEEDNPYLEAGGSREFYDAASIENLGSQCCTPTSCP
jgi:hypothetical protein